jgi:hypothetical protein
VRQGKCFSGGKTRERRGRMRLCLIGLFLIASAFCLAPTAAAQAEVQTHEFDPVLSLTGGCGTSTVDPVADPDCPSGGHPPKAFSRPAGVAIDAFGDIYISNWGANNEGSEGRIDIFDSAGHFITEFIPKFAGEPAPARFPGGLAVDSEGYLYVLQSKSSGDRAVVRYTASSFPPTGTTEYISPTTIDSNLGAGEKSVAVDPADNHVYVAEGPRIAEYASAKEGSGLIDDTIGAGSLFNGEGVAVNGLNGDIYASSTLTGPQIPSSEEEIITVIKVFGGGEGHPLKETIDGSDTPAGRFLSTIGRVGIALDQSNGDLYVSDILGNGPVYQFRRNEGGKYGFISKVEHSFQYVSSPTVAFDSSASSPNQGYLFVTSHPSGIGHLFAFEPKPEEGPPIVTGEAFSGVGASEALLEAEVNPNGAASNYRVEYVDEATFEQDIAESGPGHGFDHALKAPEPDASLAAGSAAVPVFVPISGLEPATKYHFRVVAENPLGITAGEEHVFATYPQSSAGLPDSRSYELVTPPDTNGRLPTATGIGLGDGFESSLTMPNGASGGIDLLFETTGGTLPGSDGSGSFNGDIYRAERGPSGWQTTLAEPTGAQSTAPFSGGFSPDRYAFWHTGLSGDRGSLVIEGQTTHYLRNPDGSFELVGRGSLGEDPRAVGRWITAGAAHVIFTSAVQLEPQAPASGVSAVYDRTPYGATHVVSLLPGDLTPPGGPGEAGATYLGSSADGSAVAFKVKGTMYVRLDNAETKEVALGETAFGGLSKDGGRLFYLGLTEAPKPEEILHGDIFAYDTATGEAKAIGSGGESILVNVSADGSHVYFVSPKVLDEAEEGIVGKDNLYAWDGSTVRFIATVDHLDVTGTHVGNGSTYGGLGLWALNGLGSVSPINGPGNDPSRTTSDGRFFVFESHADLTGYDSEGRTEVYRYDAVEESLLCLSCNPSLAPARSDARLESLVGTKDQFAPETSVAPTANVSEDGRMVFFETEDALVPGDVDETQDVYEWEAEGAGACQTQGGCLYLISSGHSATSNYLYAVTPDGHDVFFRTGDQLLRADTDATPSIYDARIGGGFPEAQQPPCQAEACRGQASASPALSGAGSAAFVGPGNVKPRNPGARRCAKGERKIKRRGKTRCVKRHRRSRGGLG